MKLMFQLAMLFYLLIIRETRDVFLFLESNARDAGDSQKSR